ncbi:MAG TPA: phosphate ABC transporter permease subunit PstC [Bacteroidota bacterium]|nr:phosphate ABC transporter permease subunit PstC [Bacteroidota bacterium]
MAELQQSSLPTSAGSVGGEGKSDLPPVANSNVTEKSLRRNPGDFLFKHFTMLFAAVVFLLVFLVGFEMFRGSLLSIEKFGWKFLATTTWDPVHDEYGALPFIFGTVVTSLIGLAIALPLSLGVAIFLSEIAPRWVAQPLSFLVELLAAIPSIVYGLWGIFVLVPWMRGSAEPFLSNALGFLPFFKGPAYGFGMLTAGIILAIMVLPIITSISRDVFRSIPNAQREAALALGATSWETIRIIFKDAKSGIVGATLLGLGRAVGETMAVTMVIGNRPDISASLFNPAYSMASVIANEFTEATSDLYISSLVELALVLFGLTILLNTIARLIVWSVSRRFRAA